MSANVKTRLDGQDLRAMFSAATALFERNVGAINALNVFPVPDGDTGTNMFLTLQAVVEKAHAVAGDSASDVAAAMADGALMGARGNSGVILSQFFKGVAVGLDSEQDCGPPELARALASAKEYSYRAVGNPVEGTLLTVISSVAEAAEGSSGPDVTLPEFYDTVLEAAKDSVAKTPTMLAVLREAGVVDAGGQGLAVVLEGAARWVKGEETPPYEIEPPEAIGVDGPTGEVAEHFLESAAEEEYGYCTQFMIEGSALEPDAIRTEMDEMARSTVVVGDSNLIKVHVHAEDPGPVVSAAVVHGTLSQVNIQNMDEQRAEFAGSRQTASAPDRRPLSVVAVASGKGLEELFASLGASDLVVGGDTMNPSVQDLLEAIAEAPSESVIVLPNNRNIVSAAEQAADMSEKEVAVVPSMSIPEGVAAILSLDAEGALDQNAAAMNEAIDSVKTGEVTEAVRTAKINSVPVKPGQLIGLLEHELVVAGTDLSQVVAALLEKAGVSAGDLVTLYWGDPVSEEVAQETARTTGDRFPTAEIELVKGGQPHYHFLVSIE